MKKKAITHLTAITAVFLCFALIFGSAAAFAADTRPDESITKIVIKNQSGVLEGETLQLTATVDTNRTFFDSVEWSSSNPDIISCTKDGKITGLVAGKSAKITCKAKYGKTSDEITVYCVKKLSAEVKSGISNYVAIVYSYPNPFSWKDFCLDISPLVKPLSGFFYILSFMSSLSSVNSVISKKLTVCGKSGSYAYIRYGENNSLDGFVKSTKLKNAGNNFLKLSATDMCVWADGIQYESRKLTTGYKGDIQWTVEHENDYLRFDRETGQVTGLVPGKTATITATADGETATCTIHLLYEWPQAWTAKTNRNTNIYYAVGNGYSKGAALSKNTEFVVEGDCGTNDGWAYGYISGTETWGFVPVSHISTKGTVSQYNNLNWVWPVRDTKNGVPQTKKATYISSPYGWRDKKPKNHQGIDITTGTAGEISGYDVVPAFSGTVVFCGDEYGYDWGYCVAIRSDEVDPISGLPYIAVYMHLMYAPNVSENQKVAAGETILGYVGKTTTPENQSKMGYHLHFEFNNQNSSIGISGNKQTSGYGRKSFDYLVNPIFIYMDEYEEGIITYNPSSEAEKYKKTFWYGNGDTYEEAS